MTPTALTARTQISAINALTASADFPVKEVFATSRRTSSLPSVEIPWLSSNEIAFSAASRNPSQMTVG